MKMKLKLTFALLLTVLCFSLQAEDIVCAADLTGDGYADSEGETAICESDPTGQLHYCPLGAVQCEDTEVETIAPAVATCPDDYRLSSDESYCFRDTVVRNPPEYNCPSGYTYKSSAGRCEKVTTHSVNPTYSCPSGQQLNGDQCYATISGNRCGEVSELPMECRMNYSNSIRTEGSYYTTYRWVWNGSTIANTQATNMTMPGPDNSYYIRGGKTDLSGNVRIYEICRCPNEATIRIGPATRSCPANYTYHSSSGKCRRQTTEHQSPTIVCPNGGSYNSSLGMCEKGQQIRTDVLHVCPIEGQNLNLTTGQCEDTEIVQTCPISSSFACVPSRHGGSFCSANPCMRRSSEEVTNEIDGRQHVDNGTRDESGICLDQIMIFTGRGQECKRAGIDNAYTSCCSGAEVVSDSMGSATEMKYATSTIRNIYQVTSAAGSAYASAIGSGATQASAANAASSAASAEISALMNPATIAWAVAIYFVVDYLLAGCDTMSLETSMANDSGLCHEIGEYCSRSWLGACVQRSKSFCCFNTKMARIVHEQGREQLKSFDGWGDVANPDCRGFTPEEFQALDFSRIDMSEYYDDLIHETQQRIQSDIESSFGDYFDAME